MRFRLYWLPQETAYPKSLHLCTKRWRRVWMTKTTFDHTTTCTRLRVVSLSLRRTQNLRVCEHDYKLDMRARPRAAHAITRVVLCSLCPPPSNFEQICDCLQYTRPHSSYYRHAGTILYSVIIVSVLLGYPVDRWWSESVYEWLPSRLVVWRCWHQQCQWSYWFAECSRLLCTKT